LLLTKPLGTGIISFAAQIGRAPNGAADAAVQSMAQLNRKASELMIACGAHACTDVTGFGLMGHLSAMAAASGVDVEIVWDDLPLLPGVLECLAQGIASGAVERNRESCGDSLTADPNIQPAALDICFDPQTSGGLLMAVAPSVADELLAQLHAAGMIEAAVIGRVLAGGSGRVLLRTMGQRTIPTTTPIPSDREASVMRCCEGEHSPDQAAGETDGGAGEAGRLFKRFLQAANAPGALDAKTKQAIAIALSVVAKCEPCVQGHIKKARQMGFSQDEIDEAAWMAIAFGGSPTMMFYNGLRNSG
jgi:AhpD family alkylhydroperoxidase